MSKYGDLIKQARSPENQKTRKPAPKKEVAPVVVMSGEDVNLSIKVPLAKRRYWVAQAKLQGTTITETITEALTKKFGEPERA